MLELRRLPVEERDGPTTVEMEGGGLEVLGDSSAAWISTLSGLEEEEGSGLKSSEPPLSLGGE
jgi:hypothetical protein